MIDIMDMANPMFDSGHESGPIGLDSEDACGLASGIGGNRDRGTVLDAKCWSALSIHHSLCGSPDHHY